MLSKNQKRIILIIIDLLFSTFIWHVNASWGNTFNTCLILSTTTFLIVFTPFEIYWSFRDIWYDRWKIIQPEKMEDITKIEVTIEVDNGDLIADLIKTTDYEKIKNKNTIIIISHGFSDTKETIQYYYYPLVFHGYVILAYDARGIGKSKKTGNRSQFLKRIEDFDKILEWVKNNDEIKNMKIYCVGFSIGALTVICGGFENKEIEKIIGISTISNYRQNLPKFNILVLFSYFLKGVKLYPNNEENQKLSPYILFKSMKDKTSEEEWSYYSKKVMLIHCINDKIIKFKNFKENQLILNAIPKNLLILKKGGHSQKKNELALVGASINFFNN